MGTTFTDTIQLVTQKSSQDLNWGHWDPKSSVISLPCAAFAHSMHCSSWLPVMDQEALVWIQKAVAKLGTWDMQLFSFELKIIWCSKYYSRKGQIISPLYLVMDITDLWLLHGEFVMWSSTLCIGTYIMKE